ncbi:MAG: Probable Co/Zn/Cd efflux system membrane fusion protein [uncultured Sulfurovum sp.]|uniref:Probable Co/Zn/Cd efflux system membrane fusion protein n=1 Tax=uncultured Sulfurovum sp. TaxID=269237 RepID=A0A6S6SKD6_9BACT|nr:MAG: Probable Co/Zn/Cd efflux system membrane fusion protein [uncultured Sulfurovum sp.]
MKNLLIIFALVTGVNAVTVEQLFNVKTVKVTTQSIEKSRTYNGYVQIADDKMYTVSLTQDGFIRGLRAANIYDEVRKGEKLFEIYSPEVYKAQIELLSAKKVSRSLAKNIETKLELYDVSRRNIHMIKKSNKASKYLPFYSPYSGIVIEKSITEGSAVKQGMEVYKLADLSSVWVVAKAYEADRAYIHKGSKVQVTLGGDKNVYSATVDFIYPVLDRVNKTIDFRITLENKNGKIQPNSYATIKSIQTQTTNLVLPTTAVVTKGHKHLVFVPGEYEGEYKSQRIEAKRISSTLFQIVSGLKEGDVVVNNSLFLIDSDIVINGEE